MHPARQPELYVEWLFTNSIITKDESELIKNASIQAIDHCMERVRGIGQAILGDPLIHS